MKPVHQAIRGLAIEVAFTCLIAWLGQRCIPGFDIRGPFLLNSPFVATLLFGIVVLHHSWNQPEDAGAASQEDEELIQRTASEFGLGHVETRKQARMGKQVVAIMTERGQVYQLPTEWMEFDVNARRFAVVRALASTKASVWERFAKQIKWFGVRVPVMLLVGVNLWFIVVSHAFFAIWMAVDFTYRRERFLTAQDVAALKIMRDLKAGISFVTLDKTNAALGISAETRIGALKSAAFRLGLQDA